VCQEEGVKWGFSGVNLIKEMPENTATLLPIGFRL
jgi:hypothetical protein